MMKTSQVLPTLPAVAITVLRMSRDPRVSIEKLAEAIERDPALAAKTLRFANSSYYGASQPIVSLPQALIRLGIRSAKMLALSFSLVGMSARIGPGGFNYGAFWCRSVTTSVTARRIALRSVRHVADQAFVGALLADIGCPVLATAFPDRYRCLEQSTTTGLRDLYSEEQRALGIAHPAVGQHILETWHLPQDLARAVGAHHDLAPLDTDSEAFTLGAIIQSASDLADVVIHGAAPERTRRLAAAFREYFLFGAEHIDVLLRDLGPEIRQVADMLSVPPPPADQLHAEAKGEMLKLALSEAAPNATLGSQT